MGGSHGAMAAELVRLSDTIVDRDLRISQLEHARDALKAVVLDMKEKMKIFETASYADSVQGEAAWKGRAEVAELALVKEKERVVELEAERDILKICASDREQDVAALIRLSQFLHKHNRRTSKDSSVNSVIAWVKAAETRAAELEEQIETQQGLKELLARAEKAEAEAAAMRDVVEQQTEFLRTGCDIQPPEAGAQANVLIRMGRRVLESGAGKLLADVITEAERLVEKCPCEHHQNFGGCDILCVHDRMYEAVEEMRKGK